MPTIDFLKKQFPDGFDSGDILADECPRRRVQEVAIGGSYREVFETAIRPYLRTDSVVLELGPGAGSWSRAILQYIPEGKLHAIDFQDITKWLNPEQYGGRLVCHRVEDNMLGCIDDDSIDFCWSFGVFCHNNIEHIEQALASTFLTMKPGGFACHEYGDWSKLEAFGWERTIIPTDFRDKPDDEIWWPRNSSDRMKRAAEETGWTVLCVDLDLVKRDGIILLRKQD